MKIMYNNFNYRFIIKFMYFCAIIYRNYNENATKREERWDLQMKIKCIFV